MGKAASGKTRFNIDLDDRDASQLRQLQSDMGSSSYADTIRRLSDFASAVKAEISSGNQTLDLKLVKHLLFSRI